MKMNTVDADLSAWENEGGALAPDWADNRRGQVEPSSEEQRILGRLGSGVVAEWKDLPTEIQRRLFNHATSSAVASCDPIGGKEQIARFLHAIVNERDDARGSKRV